jgi:hypothetical protein
MDHNTNTRTIHATRRRAMTAPITWTIQSPGIFGFPKLNTLKW